MIVLGVVCEVWAMLLFVLAWGPAGDPRSLLYSLALALVGAVLIVGAVVYGAVRDRRRT